MAALDHDDGSAFKNPRERVRLRQSVLEKIARLRRELDLSTSEACRAETRRVIGYFESILTDVSP